MITYNKSHNNDKLWQIKHLADQENISKSSKYFHSIHGLKHPIFLLFEILKKIKAKMKRNEKIEDNLVTSNRWNDRSCVNKRLREIQHFFSVKETGSIGLCNRRLAYLCSLVPTSWISSQSYELTIFFSLKAAWISKGSNWKQELELPQST